MKTPRGVINYQNMQVNSRVKHSCHLTISEACRKNVSFKTVKNFVILKEGLVGTKRRIGYTLPINPSFGMTTTKVLIDMFFAAHTSCM